MGNGIDLTQCRKVAHLTDLRKEDFFVIFFTYFPYLKMSEESIVISYKGKF